MINQEDLLKKYDDKTANYYLLDIRTPAEFAAHHIPVSTKLPIDELESRPPKSPKLATSSLSANTASESAGWPSLRLRSSRHFQ